MALPSRIAKYEIQRPIRQGGMGSVYLGFDPELERRVAIKVLRDDLEIDDPGARFIREARAAAGLRHPNIVTIYDFGVVEGAPYIVMEFIPGETLADIIAQRLPLPLSRRLQIVEDLCGAVAYAHRMQLVHRDIKPGNVMFDSDGAVKVLDFGLARTADSALTREGVVMGTLNYMSPEQLAGEPIDHRSDIFAIGTVLYELLAFRRAFTGGLSDGIVVKILHREPEPLPPLSHDIDAELAAVVHRALRKDPAERYQDLPSLRLALLRIRMRLDPADVPIAPAETATVVLHAGGAGVRLRSVALLEEARLALSTGEFARAIAACDEAIELDPAVRDTASALRARAEIARNAAPRRADPDPGVEPHPWRGRRRTGLALTAAAALAVLASLVQFTRGAAVATPSPAIVRGAPATPVAPAGSIAAPNAAPVDRRPPGAAKPVTPRQEQPNDRAAQATRADANPTTAPGRPARDDPKPEAPLPSVEMARVVEAAPAPAPSPVVPPAPEPLTGRPLASRTSTPVAASASSGDAAALRLPAPESQTDDQLIDRTLQRYAAAMTARDLDALGSALVMDAAARRRQASSFQQSTTLSVRLRALGAPVIEGSTATVRCEIGEVVEVRGRARRSGVSLVDVSLRKDTGRWMVVGFVDR